MPRTRRLPARAEAEPERFFVPPHVGHLGWIGVRLDVHVDWDEIATIVDAAYRMVAPKRLIGDRTLVSDTFPHDRRRVENSRRSSLVLRSGSPESATRRRGLALSSDLADYRLVSAEAPEVRRVLADVTFDKQLTLHGSRRRAELITYGGGHTSSDAFLHLPDDRVALMGDLLFTGSHPGFTHGDPREWQRTLRRVRELDLERVVPGPRSGGHSA